MFNTTRQPMSGKRERKTVSTTAVSITESVYVFTPTVGNVNAYVEPVRATAAIVQVLTNPVNFTIDGTTPEAAVGFNAVAGDFIYLDSAQKVRNFKAIRSGGADAAIEVVALFGS